MNNRRVVVWTVIIIAFFGFLGIREHEWEGIYNNALATEEKVDVSLSYIKIFEVFNKMYGTITVKNQKEEAIWEYKFNNFSIVENSDSNFFFVSVIEYDAQNNEFEDGRIYCSQDYSDLIIVMDEFEIYASSDEFIRKVKEFNE